MKGDVDWALDGTVGAVLEYCLEYFQSIHTGPFCCVVSQKPTKSGSLIFRRLLSHKPSKSGPEVKTLQKSNFSLDTYLKWKSK